MYSVHREGQWGANFAQDGKCHVLQRGTVPVYRGTMARRSIRKNGRESLDPKSLNSFRVFLGPIAAQYSDAQLVQLDSEMRAAARLLLDLYLLKKQNLRKRQDKVFDNSGSEP